MTRRDIYRYVVEVSVKNVDALEDLILHTNDDHGLLLLDVTERQAFKRAEAKEEVKE